MIARVPEPVRCCCQRERDPSDEGNDQIAQAGSPDTLCCVRGHPFFLPRRAFIRRLAIASGAAVAASRLKGGTPKLPMSDFSRRLTPVGRILEQPGWYVWCNAPIEGPDGRIHVFFSRWPESKGMGGWLTSCEIAHAVADQPEGPYEMRGTALAPRPGQWDASTCHNPHIQRIGDRYALFYMGASNGRTNTKRIGLATAPSLDGPWTRSDQPLLLPGPEGAWDDHCTTNPALVLRPNGEYWLYYKSWNTADYLRDEPPIRGNRKYGVAISRELTGPYKKHPENPVVDFSSLGDNRQCEDAYVWFENGLFRMIVRDMGVFNHEVGLILESNDGVQWSSPEVAYLAAENYIDLPPAPPHLRRYGRFERPQLLMRNGRPSHLFTAAQGGRANTASGFVFRID